MGASVHHDDRTSSSPSRMVLFHPHTGRIVSKVVAGASLSAACVLKAVGASIARMACLYPSYDHVSRLLNSIIAQCLPTRSLHHQRNCLESCMLGEDCAPKANSFLTSKHSSGTVLVGESIQQTQSTSSLVHQTCPRALPKVVVLNVNLRSGSRVPPLDGSPKDKLSTTPTTTIVYKQVGHYHLPAVKFSSGIAKPSIPFDRSHSI